jgi:SPP1 gp7 family putative phage head morphogenesis protein
LGASAPFPNFKKAPPFERLHLIANKDCKMTTPLWIQRLQFQYRLQGMVNGLEAEMIPIFEGALEKTTGKLVALEAKADKARNYKYKKKYLDRQKYEVQKILKDVYRETGDLIKARSIELALQMPEMTAIMLEKAEIGPQLGMPHLDRKTVNAWFESSQVEGTYFNDWMKKLETNAAARIVAEVREAKVLGESLSKTAKRIQNALSISRKSAVGIAHNSLHQAAIFAERNFWQEPKNKQKIKGLRFVCELDRKTTPLCRSLDQRVFKVDEAPQPPLYWRCRSHLIPMFKWDTKKDLNEATRPARVEMGGRTVKHRDKSTSTKYERFEALQIPAGRSYNQWMNNMVHSKNPEYRKFAREALGPTRYKLVRDGKLKMNQLYYAGKLRTIAKLKELI